MLEQIKILLGITDNSKDALLTVLIGQATDEALNYTHQKNTTNLNTSIIQMVVYKYNRIGTEGLDSENYSGVSFAYSGDYPEQIIRGLKAQRKVVVL